MTVMMHEADCSTVLTRIETSVIRLLPEPTNDEHHGKTQLQTAVTTLRPPPKYVPTAPTKPSNNEQ
jgi:hypothetical protein